MSAWTRRLDHARASEGRQGVPPGAEGVPLTGAACTTTVRVRYAETDQMGVVYYANYFVWFEVGRADLLRSLGWSYREMEGAGIVLPVIEAECRYVKAARYDDELEVRTQGRTLSAVRMEFRYDVVRREDGATAATGRTVHAALSREGRPCRLPDRIREVFA